jgi:hypothetical protein
MSDAIRMYSPSGFSARHSAVTPLAASSDRATKYTRDWAACLTNAFIASSPMPLVASTKTATGRGGSPAICVFDEGTSLRLTHDDSRTACALSQAMYVSFSLPMHGRDRCRYTYLSASHCLLCSRREIRALEHSSKQYLYQRPTNKIKKSSDPTTRWSSPV